MENPNLQIVPDAGVIEIRGARQNNLKGFDLDVPIGKLSVVTGPSGSGKSSLAFDTIYAEGQRRYVETFSPYTRQFLERMDKPKVNEIRGIPPAIAIEQANPVKTTRSTVGTITELNDYLKLLLPRIVEAVCPSCQRAIRPESARAIVEQVFAAHPGETLLVTFGVPVPPKTDPAEFFAFLQQQGYLRVWIDGDILRTDEPPPAERLPALIRVIQDRLAFTEENRPRIAEAVETALRFGKGRVAFLSLDPRPSTLVLPFSTGWHCAHCDLDIAPPTAGLFSFNHPLGACPQCRGFGRTIAIDLERAIPDRRLSLAKGAIKPFQSENGRECQRDLLRAAASKEVDVTIPFEELPPADQAWVMLGERPSGELSGEELWKEGLWYGVKGFFDWLESKAYKMHVRVLLSRYRNYTVCPACHGGRYQPATLNFRVAGQTLPELMALPVSDLQALFTGHRHPACVASGLPARQSLPAFQQAGSPLATQAGKPVLPAGGSEEIAADSTTALLLTEVATRLGFLLEVGLDYLSLDRPTRTLSGGEIERVNLTTCLGASLVNTLFILDEPSVGLHPRDTSRLIRVMQSLRDKGNTLLVVEHDEAVIRAADNVIELGPGRGDTGGDLVFTGRLDALVQTPSLTAEYLTGRKSIPIPAQRRKPRGFITVTGASEHNLRNVEVAFPLGVFAGISGVSGSGKSTLVHEVLFENLLAARGLASGETVGRCSQIKGSRLIDDVVMVDQSPLSRTPRSTPALYLGVFDTIRDLFAATPDALARGLTASAFSFNSGVGRCERCGGSGFEKIEMQFLSDVFVRCPECDGKRYQRELLEIRLEGNRSTMFFR